MNRIVSVLMLAASPWMAAAADEPAPAPDAAAKGAAVVGKAEPVTVNVIVINIDPVLHTRGDKKLHEEMKWSDPWELTERMVEDARKTSHGYVDYRIVEKIDYDGFTTFRNGFTYTEEAFLDMWENDRSKANRGMTSFEWLFEKFDLARKISENGRPRDLVVGRPLYGLGRAALENPRRQGSLPDRQPMVLPSLRHPGRGANRLDHGLELRTRRRRDAGELLSPHRKRPVASPSARASGTTSATARTFGTGSPGSTRIFRASPRSAASITRPTRKATTTGTTPAKSRRTPTIG